MARTPISKKDRSKNLRTVIVGSLRLEVVVPLLARLLRRIDSRCVCGPPVCRDWAPKLQLARVSTHPYHSRRQAGTRWCSGREYLWRYGGTLQPSRQAREENKLHRRSVWRGVSECRGRDQARRRRTSQW